MAAPRELYQPCFQTLPPPPSPPLQSVDASRAQASVPVDRERILAEVEGGIGTVEMSRLIREALATARCACSLGGTCTIGGFRVLGF